MNKKTVDKYLKYFYAASNFYGAIELDEFVDAYFNEEDYDELYELFFFCFENRLIQAYKVNDLYYLTCYDNKKALKDCLREQKGKPLKVINKKELVKYANQEYHDKNALTDYMKDHGANNAMIIKVMSHIVSIYFNYVETFKYLVKNLQEVDIDELAQVLQKAANNTPIHANRGYTPKELNDTCNKLLN